MYIFCSVQSYLHAHFEGKNSGKKIICYSEVIVPRTVLVHRVFGGQGDARHEDHKHDEVVKQLLGDKPVDGLADPAENRITEY